MLSGQWFAKKNVFEANHRSRTDHYTEVLVQILQAGQKTGWLQWMENLSTSAAPQPCTEWSFAQQPPTPQQELSQHDLKSPSGEQTAASLAAARFTSISDVDRVDSRRRREEQLPATADLHAVFFVVTRVPDF